MLRMGIALPLDHPNPRSLHSAPVPRVGGVGVLLGISAAWIAAGDYAGLDGLLLLTLILAGLSFADDLHGLPVVLRLGAHLVVAGVFVWTLLPAHWGAVALLASAITTAWMANLNNFMDGSDGLAGGMALFGFAVFGVAAALGGEWTFAWAAWSISAAAAGFLWFNFHPARVFLGDIGSIPLGFLTAALGLVGIVRGLWPLWFPCLVFSPFIADATVTLMKRMLRGAKIWEAHREHYYQRMVRTGLGHRKTAFIWYAVMLGSGLSALAALTLPPTLRAGVLIGWGLIYFLAGVMVDRRWKRFVSRE